MPRSRSPTGSTADQVQGLRYTFTKTDGSNWENPANPLQPAAFTVTRRTDLHTGGPVPSDLAGTAPAPGETVAGRTTDTISADVISSDRDAQGNPLTASDDETATILYRHARNAVAVTKTPSGNTVQPGQPFTYTLTVRNAGDIAIDNPVITDRLPTDADGPMLAFPDVTGASRYTYTLTPTSGAATALPTDPALVTVAESTSTIRFTFPQGSRLAVGETYTIAFQMETRPGLAASARFTNQVGVVGDRAWDACSGTLDPGTGECRANATNTVASAGAVAVRKQVKAEGSDVLGVDLDPNAPAVACTANADGFYNRPCIPVAEPGGAVTWRMEFINSGNRPVNRIVAVDRLPARGDRLATADLARGSQWRPLLDGARPTIAHGTGTINVWYTTGADPCTDDLGTDSTACPGGSWTVWPSGTSLPADPADVTGIKIEILPSPALAPAGRLDVDVAMRAPAISPTAGADTVAYNTVGMAARWTDAGRTGYTLTTEPPRVGVALATGALRVVKTVTGPAADTYAPTSVRATLACTSVGVPVDLGDDADLTLTPGEPVLVPNLPYHARCTLTEGDNGQTTSTSTTATVEREIADVETTALTNIYEYASLAVRKTVDSAAVDQDGQPVAYGPFDVGVECTYLGAPVYADGYDENRPMQVTLTDGQEEVFTGLPATAACTVTETDDRGASAVTVTTTTGDHTETSDGHAGTVTLGPDADGDPTNTAAVTNTFDDGPLLLTKDVTGDVADTYGAGPFTLHVTCTLDDETGRRTVWDGDVVLGGDDPLSHTIDHLATGASCTVTETDTGGASATRIEPDGPVVVGGGEPVTVTVTNSFDAGRLLIDKAVTGPAADDAAESFQVEVTCSADGAVLPGFPTTVTVTPGTPTEVDTLVGADCSARETTTGGATAVTYDPAPAADVEGSGDVSIPADTAAEITVTNEYRAGGLEIVKQLSGPGASLGAGPFVFDVTCTLDERNVLTQTVILTRHGSESSLSSEPITGLPVGAVCDIVEVGAGNADQAAPTVVVTIPDVDEEGNAQVVAAGFVNSFSAAKLDVTKVLNGPGADAARDMVFTIAVTCQVADADNGRLTVYAGDTHLQGGETVTVTDRAGRDVLLPIGTRCFGTETDTGGAAKSTVDHGSFDDAAVVRSDDQLQTLTITATNTFAAQASPTSTATPSPPATQAPSDADGSLANTGWPLASATIWALGLVVGGLLVVVGSRRRRRHR